MDGVNNLLLKITHQDVVKLLDEKHETDVNAGIVIVDLPQINAEENGLTYHFHAARIYPSNSGIPNFVNPHYHITGDEPYNMLYGDSGEMNIGTCISPSQLITLRIV